MQAYGESDWTFASRRGAFPNQSPHATYSIDELVHGQIPVDVARGRTKYLSERASAHASAVLQAQLCVHVSHSLSHTQQSMPVLQGCFRLFHRVWPQKKQLERSLPRYLIRKTVKLLKSYLIQEIVTLPPSYRKMQFVTNNAICSDATAQHCSF